MSSQLEKSDELTISLHGEMAKELFHLLKVFMRTYPNIPVPNKAQEIDYISFDSLLEFIENKRQEHQLNSAQDPPKKIIQIQKRIKNILIEDVDLEKAINKLMEEIDPTNDLHTFLFNTLFRCRRIHVQRQNGTISREEEDAAIMKIFNSLNDLLNNLSMDELKS